MSNFAPYTKFGKTKSVPVVVYLNGNKIESDTWDETWWIERSEEMYGLGSSKAKGKRIRIIEREVWLRSKEI